jgi:hypothetical protein
MRYNLGPCFPPYSPLTLVGILGIPSHHDRSIPT